MSSSSPFTLYYSPGACSLAPHIALHELKVPHALQRVNLRTKLLTDGTDFRAVSPRGSVPVLTLPAGQRLTECAVILQALDDASGADPTIPRAGLERYRALEWLNFVATEMHKGIGILFGKANEEETARRKSAAQDRIAQASQLLGERTFVLGETWSVVDPYLFTTLRWAVFHGLELPDNLSAYIGRMKARASTQAALQIEGLTT